MELWKIWDLELRRVGSIVCDIGESCLCQSSIQVVITTSRMLEPEKWQTLYDNDGKICGFKKALKLIVLGHAFFVLPKFLIE
ncbi:hypothetical protein SLE2022_094810 [Rubroshorea leprosula]